jgi:hypothetical protein
VARSHMPFVLTRGSRSEAAIIPYDRRLDAANAPRIIVASTTQRPRPSRDEARHSREGIPTGSETMSNVAFPGVAVK